MNLQNAIAMTRLILGDESESIWSDEQVLNALNLSNKRIMERIVSQNPEQWVMSYEDYIAIQTGDTSVTPLSVGAGDESLNLYVALKTAWAAEGATDSRFTMKPIKLVRLSYSTTSDMKERIDIPFVPFSGLDERKEHQIMEYEVFSNINRSNRIYKASYSGGTGQIYIRPVPTRTLYLKVYWAEAGVPEISASTDLDQPLLSPIVNEASPTSHHSMLTSGRAEAVVFDACYSLSFKDQSMREACANERERILMTQHTPMSPSEAY